MIRHDDEDVRFVNHVSISLYKEAPVLPRASSVFREVKYALYSSERMVSHGRSDAIFIEFHRLFLVNLKSVRAMIGDTNSELIIYPDRYWVSEIFFFFQICHFPKPIGVGVCHHVVSGYP